MTSHTNQYTETRIFLGQKSLVSRCSYRICIEQPEYIYLNIALNPSHGFLNSISAWNISTNSTQTENMNYSECFDIYG